MLVASKSFYTLTSRRRWGANPLTVAYQPLEDAALEGLVFHYSGGPGPLSFPDACAQCRSIQHEHIYNRGFRDEAYSFFVSPQGQVFEGRGWRHRTGAQGCLPGDPGVASDGNAHYPAICYLGGQHTALTDPAKRAFLAVRREFLHLFGSHLTKVLGHQNICSTDCPGHPLYNWIQAGLPEP